jgi:hypothetical protein
VTTVSKTGQVIKQVGALDGGAGDDPESSPSEYYDEEEQKSAKKDSNKDIQKIQMFGPSIADTFSHMNVNQKLEVFVIFTDYLQFNLDSAPKGAQALD